MAESKKVKIPTAGYSSELIPKIFLVFSAVLLLIAASIGHPFDLGWTIVAALNFVLQTGMLIWTLFFKSTLTVEVVDGKPVAVREKKQRILLSEVTNIQWKKIGRSFQLHLTKPGSDDEMTSKAIIYLSGESGVHLVRKNKLSLLSETMQATSAPRSGIEYKHEKPAYFFPDQADYQWGQTASLGVNEAITELGRYVK